MSRYPHAATLESIGVRRVIVFGPSPVPPGHLAAGFFVALSLFGYGRVAAAYAWTIGRGYTSCATCHADPMGGNLLTRYGRALWAGEMTTQYIENNDDPGRVGDFLFGAVDLPDAVLLGAQVRGLFLNTRTVIEDEVLPLPDRWILMQADASGQVSIDRFRLNGTIGYIHEGALEASLTRGDENRNDRLIARTYWAGATLGPNEEWLLRAGRLNLPFGIRQPEHTFWSRVETRSDANDGQQHGLALSWTGTRARAEGMFIAGNFAVSPDQFRERGAVALIEWFPVERLGVGLSGLATHTRRDVRSFVEQVRQAYGPFVRWGLLPRVTLLSEGAILIESPSGRSESLGAVGFTTLDVEPLQGLHIQATGELRNRSFDREASDVSGWLTAWWFLLPHVDVRFDLNVQRLNGFVPVDVLAVSAQIHGSL